MAKRHDRTRRDDELAWYPYYPSDFEQGTSDMTLAEVGAYQRLINAQWAKTGIPADNMVKLAAILRCTPSVAKSVWETVSSKFVRCADGLWRNERLDKIRERQLRRRAVGQANGALGASARWQSDGKAIAKSISLPDVCDGNMGSKTVEIPDPDPEDQNTERSDLPALVARGRFQVFWAEYPRKKARGAAWKAWQRLKPTAELTSQMLTAIGQQRTSREWREGFIPHPATWLNQERWTDEIEGRLAAPGAPEIPFWDECPTCGDIHPRGQACPPSVATVVKAGVA